MTNKRKKWTQEEFDILLLQCNGQCPLCHTTIRPGKKGDYIGEIAHIYPLNPSSKELKAYEGLPQLSKDVNSLDNLIMLCPNCHTNYDKYPSKEKYEHLFEIKNQLIQNDKIRNAYSTFTIEEEIIEVINSLLLLSEYEFETLNYDAHTIDQKLGSDFPLVSKIDIKQNVGNYYNYIRNIFKEIDSTKMRCFDQIASQIKSISIQIERYTQSKEQTYDYLCKWLSDKTGRNKTACRIVIAFFIQNCEIFDVSQ